MGNQEFNKELSSKDPLQEKPGKGDFLIVGIGASAGGVRALQEFFSHVPANSGMAWVVILHLSPDYESQLVSVLQKETSLPVTDVNEKINIQPDHIYVVSPNQHLILGDNWIDSSVNVLMEERRAPVDIFFRTLADQYGTRAVAVILSGTGANGSMGFKRVKEKGGVCFVQNPREAEFNEMPRNAIATALVDEVLPVADIPAKILSYKAGLGTIEIVEDVERRPEEQQQALRDIFTQLKLRTGHDFSNYKRPTLLRRIERRINIRSLADLPAYARFLQENPEEPVALLKDLLISVTNFFRDKRPFEVIEQEILPLIFKDKTSQDNVRIWVAGCATGEEAYSIAMLCAEKVTGIIDAPKVQIFATDIDESAIATAREGLYTLNDTADVSPERLRRFFNKEGESYRIRREIRETIMFAPHNFLKDPPFSHLDLVSCRNVMIYLNRAAQERVVETFHFALNPGGYLFLGTSESVEGVSGLYAIHNRENHIFQSRQVRPNAYPIPESTPALFFDKFKKDLSTQEPENKGMKRISYGDLHQQLLEQYAAPSLVVNEEYDILHLTERAGKYLQITGGELSQNLLILIKPELRLELRLALYQATQRQMAVEARSLKVVIDEKAQTINIHVRPVLRAGDTAKGFILVIFEPASEAAGHEILLSSDEPVARQLEEELVRVKAQLRASNEQHDFQAEEMKASNEELQAMNEELRSAAEELESSKEELQSINEELRTVNQELKVKIEETSIASNNLQNLINSTDIGTIFLDRSLRVALYTPAAVSIFNLIPADYGRPLSDITSRLEDEEILNDAEKVLEKLNVIEREVRTNKGKIYLMRFTPYRTDEDRIKGVVITFVDITGRKQTEEALRAAEEKYRLQLEHDVEQRTKELNESKELLQTVFDVSTTSISVLEIVYDEKREVEDFQVLMYNAFTLRTNGHRNVIGQRISKAFPRTVETGLLDRYKEVALSGQPADFEMWYEGEGISSWFRTMVNKVGNLLVITAEDITERKRSEQEIIQKTELLETTMNSSPDMIQVFEAVRSNTGEIVDFRWVLNNHTSKDMYGDVIGKSLLALHPAVTASGIFERMVNVVETGVSQEHKRFYSSEYPDQWFYLALVKQGDGVIMTTRDITKQVTGELELLTLKDELAKTATDKYLELFNSIDEGFCIIEVLFDDSENAYDYRFLEANKAFERQTGLTNVVGKTIKELGLTNAPYWLNIYGKIIKTGEPARFENEEETIGHYYEVYAFQTGKPGENRVAVLFYDISERKKEEERKAYLLELSDALRPFSDPLQIQDMAMRLVGKYLHADRAWYYDIQDGQMATTSRGYSADEIHMPQKFPLSRFGSHYLSDYAQNKTIVVEDVAKDVRFSKQERQAWQESNISGGVGIPFNKAGQLCAVLGIHSIKPRSWTAEEIALLEETAERTWAAVERARIEKALRESEQRLKMAMKAGGQFSWEIDPDTQIITYSGDQQEVLGFVLPPSLQDLLGLVHPGDLEVLREAYNKAMANNTTMVMEQRLFVPESDNLIWVRVEGQFFDTPPRFIGTIRNITADKEAQDALRESEERLRVTMESAIDFVIITMNMEGEVQQWNTGAERILGYSAEEMQGELTDIIFVEEDRAAGIPQKELEKARTDGYAEDERWHQRKNGSRLFMSGMTRAICNPELTGYVKVARDMTEQQQAQKQLKLFEERYRIALQSAGMGAWDWNVKTDKVIWNENHYTLLGIPPDSGEKDTSYFLQFIHPDDKKAVSDALKHAVDTAGTYSAEFRIIRQDNNAVLWMTGYGNCVSSESGRATRIVGVMFDITEQKLFTHELSRLVSERTMELQRSNEDLQQFAHVASHDLKEPVRKVRTFNNRIIEEFADILPQKVKSYLERIESASNRMYAMIEGVLNYSKLDIAVQPLQAVNLNDIIHQIETDLEVMIQSKKAVISKTDLPSIEAYPVLIYQLFYNLILNSLKFAKADEPSLINISATTVIQNDTEFLKITLSDNGIGFEPEYAESIFNTFTRLHSADKYEGSGLGLALCKKIVERHHGFISASGKKNEGAIFNILLPLKQLGNPIS